jgi:hypothetical protein
LKEIAVINSQWESSLRHNSEKERAHNHNLSHDIKIEKEENENLRNTLQDLSYKLEEQRNIQ